MENRLGQRLAAACGALYVVLLVSGDDFISPAGEPPEADAKLSEVSAYLERADSSSFWLGRSIGLLGLCALLVFVVYVSRRIRDEEGHGGVLSGLALAAGSVAVALQFLAAPAQFAAVQGASQGLDPQVAQALLHASVSFQLSFLPLALFLGAVAAASVLPRWLSIGAGLLGVGLVAGLIGQPEEPAVIAFMAFALGLLWFVAASVVLVRRVGRPAPARGRPPARAAAVAGGMLALVLSAGLAACGDDDKDKQGLSKQDYIAKANASCVKHEKAAGAAVPRIIGAGRPTAEEAQRFLSQAVVPALRDGTAERAKLPAPQGDDEQIRAINSAAKKAVAGFKRIAVDRSRAHALMLGKASDPATEVDTLNRRYGIEKCGGGN